MHKGIRLSLKLWIEGEDEPAHDFAAYTKQAVQKMLAAGKELHPELYVIVRSIEEDVSWEDDETRAG